MTENRKMAQSGTDQAMSNAPLGRAAVRRLRAEIERLRAALLAVIKDADEICTSAIVILPETLAAARAALKRKKP